MAEAYMVFRKVEDFAASWENESGGTRKILGALTDVSLKHGIAKGHRDIGRVAWHIVCTIAEMANRTGLKVDGPSDKDPVPASVVEIQKAYDKAAGMLLEQVKRYWTDETLTQIDDMYGEKWPRGLTMPALLNVLMLGFAWLPVAALLYSVQSLWLLQGGEFILGRAPAHALFIGFFGSLLVAMVTRVSQGHSGRPLRLGGAAAFAFTVIQLTVLVRIGAELAPDILAWHSAAGLLWLLAFLPWVLRSAWIYLTPRADGKAG